MFEIALSVFDFIATVALLVILFAQQRINASVSVSFKDIADTLSFHTGALQGLLDRVSKLEGK